MRIVLILLFTIDFLSVRAQFPVADFSIPLNACTNQNIYLKNLSSSSTSYQWDFCDGDLKQAPTGSLLTNAYGGYGTRMEVEEDNGVYVGFLLSGGTQNLYRLNFGNSLTNNPNLESLGNLGLNSNQLRAITIVKEGALYFGFIIDSQKNTLYRLDFGTSLQNTPQTPVVVYQGNPLNTPFQLTTVTEGISNYIFVTNNADGNLIRLKFTSGFAGSISETFSIAVSSQWLNSVSFLKENGVWHAACVSPLLGQILKIDFVNGLGDNTPVVTFINSVTPISAELVNENGLYYILAQSRNPQLSLIRLSFGSTLSNVPIATEMPNIGFGASEIWNFSLFSSKSDWVGFGVEQIGQSMYRVQFPNKCFSSTQYSEEFEPKVVSSSSGLFSAALRAKDTNGNTSFTAKNITITAQISPDIDISIQNQCVNNSVLFTPINSSGNITFYQWNFGDGSNASSVAPSHIYVSPTFYKPSLIVNSIAGCQNEIQKPLQIFNEPSAAFTMAAVPPICTNQTYTFTNVSSFEAGANPSWQWSVNGLIISSAQNLSFNFVNTNPQTISLQAIIPGCSSTFSQTINSLITGPLVNFSFPASGCQSTPTSFTNTTTGTVTGYQWTFGDGNSSLSLNGVNAYSTAGTYSVTLQANNAAGCQNALTKSITIYTKPQPDFSLGLPPFSCAGTASQFTDQTPSPTDSNITTWTWGFGDAANGSSSVKNPSYTYATANTYNVSLAVATNFGCTNSIQKFVTISPSPVAGFTNLPACVNQATQFTDVSSGSIKSRQWQIQGSTFNTPNPQYTYASSGTYPVVLTVTGNNNCVSQASKNIVVPIVPSLDFLVQAPCANSPTVFTELTTTTDPSISKSWSFGSQGTGSGSPVQYVFSSTGTYVVRLNSTRQSGCVYSVSKNVSIISPPVADFVPSIDAGAAPLPVSFANNSSGANSYLWKFGDSGNSTSVLVSPTFVFSELGSYNVELSAFNSVGCTNRLSKPISVVIPNVDAEMTDFFFVKDPKTGSLQPVVKLLNRSNITLTNPIILLDVAGGSGVSLQLTGIIKPNQEVSQMLDLKLVPKTNQYVCAEVVVAGDVDTFLNRKCLSLSGEEVLFTPFPNPAREQLNMDWISIDGSSVTFQVLTSAGAASFQQTISPINPGLNRLIINTSALLPGIYFIRFRDSKTDRTFSFAVTGN